MRTTCSNCGTRLSGCPGTGLCPRCVKLVKFSGRKCTVCKAPIGKGSKSGVCKNCKEREDVSSLLRRVRTGVWTTCHMPGCDEYFELSNGQHPKMAWCDKCRRTPNYKNHRVYQNLIREVKL